MLHLGLYYPNLAGRFILFPLRARAALHVSEPTCHGKQKTVARQTRFPWCKCGSTLTNEMQRKKWEHITKITKKLLFFMFFQLGCFSSNDAERNAWTTKFCLTYGKLKTWKGLEFRILGADLDKTNFQTSKPMFQFVLLISRPKLLHISA